MKLRELMPLLDKFSTVFVYDGDVNQIRLDDALDREVTEIEPFAFEIYADPDDGGYVEGHTIELDVTVS